MEPRTDSIHAVRARSPRRSRSRTPAARRKRKQRARHKNGEHHYRMWISDRAVEGLILKCIIEGRLSEADALEPRCVENAIKQLLEEEGQRWAR
jgi:hypothetical protein